ncbi:DUF1679 domain-containing protein [Marinomonas agarivorans]|nr:DUF1679 domain-containing protein [Marinomonas agarivorans]
MTPEVFIKRQLAAENVTKVDVIQSLWSGYGEIARYQPIVAGKLQPCIIAKHCQPPTSVNHPRGWQSDHAHQRKLQSYAVEQNWYRDWSTTLDKTARVAGYYGDHVDGTSGQRILLLEDLDAAGYDQRFQMDNLSELLVCIDWLAHFHATFLYQQPVAGWPQGLWEHGTYWHLATRQEEFRAMQDSSLKNMAPLLTEQLDKASFRTLVHGDAKVANFCFSADKKDVAALDFQYVGNGIGVQDLVYLLGSALSEDELAKHLTYCQEYYFAELGRAVMAQGEGQAFVHELIDEWEPLFLIAWADFQRFILGWSPEHHKNTALSQRLTQQGLRHLAAFY